jgi:endonuclease/exonuclease/phosphatase family metal-dependent hydrolase
MVTAALRVLSWNVRYVIGQAARREAEFLSSLDPPADIVLLQEVNRHSAEDLRRLGGLDWLRLASDLRRRGPNEPSVRQRGVAIGARLAMPISFGLLDGAPFPERAMHGVIKLGRRTITVASYHAPPGVTWKLKKVEQAVSFADWLRSVAGPTLLGADANTPRIDHPDFELLRTHWHTGSRRLKGNARRRRDVGSTERPWFAGRSQALVRRASEGTQRAPH